MSMNLWTENEEDLREETRDEQERNSGFTAHGLSGQRENDAGEQNLIE